MLKMSRKDFLQQMAAGCMAFVLPLRESGAEGEPREGSAPLMIPYPAKPWAQATRIIGSGPQPPLPGLKGNAPSFDRTPLYNDFCLAQSSDGRWHCIGILFEGRSQAEFRQDRLFHYVADSLGGPYHSVGYLDLGYGKEAGVWAPCIVREGRRALMYYAYAGKDRLSIRVAQAEDAQFNIWRRGAAGHEIVATEEGARDPEIIRDKRTGLYLMFYVCAVKSGHQWTGVVRVRTSADLLNWSKPRTVLGTPPGYEQSESVFVLQENGHYYMWVSSATDYGLMSLYISMDPFNFGDAVANRIEEQRGHAPEIVRAEDRYWMACVAIASVPGLDTAKQHDLPIGQHDLEGVWLQPLEWRTASAEAKSKVVSRQ
jgi:hypothetical protein